MADSVAGPPAIGELSRLAATVCYGREQAA